jgi:hypothetical protein
MRPMVPTSMDIEWTQMSESEIARFSPQEAAAVEWVLELLDETEEAKKIRRTVFDQAIQERARRAS